MLPPCDCTLQVKSPGRKRREELPLCKQRGRVPTRALGSLLNTNTQVPSQINQNQSKSISQFAATFFCNTPVRVGLIPT